MNFFKNLWRLKYALIIIFIIFFICGYFITDIIYNKYNSKYEYIFKSENECYFLLTEDFYKNTLEIIDNENISHSNIDYKKMIKNAKLGKENDIYKLTILKDFFPNMVSLKSGNTNTGSDRVVKYFNLLLDYSNANYEFVEINIINYVNPFIVGLISGSIIMFIFIIVLFIYNVILKKDLYISKANLKIFDIKYWKDSLSFGKNIKNICILSVIFACMIICKIMPIPSGFGNLGLSLTYLFFSLISLIYGPACGLFIGFCSDILGHFINSNGVFFFGYTINSMLAGFIYGICFYKKRITFVNCFIARAIVNIFINTILGSLWWKMLYNLDYEAFITYISLTSLPKNLIYLLPQSLFLFIFFKFIAKPLTIFGLIDNEIGENVKIF